MHCAHIPLRLTGPPPAQLLEETNVIELNTGKHLSTSVRGRGTHGESYQRRSEAKMPLSGEYRKTIALPQLSVPVEGVEPDRAAWGAVDKPHDMHNPGIGVVVVVVVDGEQRLLFDENSTTYNEVCG